MSVICLAVIVDAPCWSANRSHWR